MSASDIATSSSNGFGGFGILLRHPYRFYQIVRKSPFWRVPGSPLYCSSGGCGHKVHVFLFTRDSLFRRSALWRFYVFVFRTYGKSLRVLTCLHTYEDRTNMCTGPNAMRTCTGSVWRGCPVFESASDRETSVYLHASRSCGYLRLMQHKSCEPGMVAACCMVDGVVVIGSPVSRV